MIGCIIPTPKACTLLEGHTEVPLHLACTEPAWEGYAATFAEVFHKVFGCTPARATGGITLVRDGSLPLKHYRLDTREGIVLAAADDEGIVYAIASLLQAISVEGDRLAVKRALIEDWPDKDYRALMVDLARQWHPFATLLQYVDLCFMLKIKYLHLHFGDDQRYTLPSRHFPRLNEKGAYTEEEIATLNARAAARGVVIIPELETPGHATILTACYPEVFANHLDGEGDTITTEAGAVIRAGALICAGSEATMQGVRTLLDEVCALFPAAPYLHIGGDEANIRVWEHCKTCRAYMQEKGLADVRALYSEFVGRVAREVLSRGKTPIVWEGFPKEGASFIPRETVVIAWESHYHMPADLVAEGFSVINCSWQPLYIVPSLTERWGVSEIMDWDVYNWQHWWNGSPASVNPIHLPPTEQVIGAQLAVWETTFEQEFSRAMENLAALSERTWSVERRWSKGQFLNRVRGPLNRIALVVKAE